MERYSVYADHLGELRSANSPRMQRKASVKAALDGEASRELRNLLDLKSLRRDGIFFTSSRLRSFAISTIANSIDESSILYDPACGAGDLLLGGTEHLPICRTLEETLRVWSKMIRGCDIHPQFVSACRHRLVLAAWQRHGFCGQERTRTRDDWFLNVENRCGKSSTRGYDCATHVLINPPYIKEFANDRSWCTGSVNSAALFLEHALDSVRIGARIVAILPEVIRCGSRYAKFRQLIESRSKRHRVASFGLFDSQADVDVFVLDIEKIGKKPVKGASWNWGQPPKSHRTISDWFDVSVGPVVDFRDPRDRGKWYRYLTVDNVPPWTDLLNVKGSRRFQRRVVKAPFVVIRRTSRPGDTFRAVGSVIRGSNEYAVDNHLVICQPHDNTLRTCRALITRLKTTDTNNWLDRVIRCRHLTVGAVKRIPWNDHD